MNVRIKASWIVDNRERGNLVRLVDWLKRVRGGWKNQTNITYMSIVEVELVKI